MFDSLSPHGVVAATLIAPPGPEAIAALAPLVHTALSGTARVDLLVALDRQTSWLASIVQPVMVKVADAVESEMARDPDPLETSDMPLRAAHGEIGAALRIADTTAASQLNLARGLVEELPIVHAALAAGELTVKQAEAIIDCTKNLSSDKARAVAEKVLPKVRRQTVGQLRRCLNR
ncbi:MAG TPA: DUF222 domain-containing protein, partial [Frankiaceae bacterium]|nr:DUF222 domain-containing protein [Frankiaceae bacterium]